MPTESGHTSRSARILSTVAAGEFKETLGDRSRRRLTDLSAQLHSRECLSAFRFNERVRPKEVRTPDPNGHFELGGHSPRAGAFGRLAVSGMVDFYVWITLLKLGEAYDNLEDTRDCDSFRCGGHDLGRGGGLCPRYRTVCRTAQPRCPEECSDGRAQSGQWGLQSRHVGHDRESRWTGMRSGLHRFRSRAAMAREPRHLGSEGEYR